MSLCHKKQLDKNIDATQNKHIVFEKKSVCFYICCFYRLYLFSKTCLKLCFLVYFFPSKFVVKSAFGLWSHTCHIYHIIAVYMIVWYYKHHLWIVWYQGIILQTLIAYFDLWIKWMCRYDILREISMNQWWPSLVMHICHSATRSVMWHWNWMLTLELSVKQENIFAFQISIWHWKITGHWVFYTWGKNTPSTLHTVNTMPANAWAPATMVFISCTRNILGLDSIWRYHLASIRNPLMEIQWSWYYLISTMGFSWLVRQHLYIEMVGISHHRLIIMYLIA